MKNLFHRHFGIIEVLGDEEYLNINQEKCLKCKYNGGYATFIGFLPIRMLEEIIEGYSVKDISYKMYEQCKI